MGKGFKPRTTHPIKKTNKQTNKQTKNNPTGGGQNCVMFRGKLGNGEGWGMANKCNILLFIGVKVIKNVFTQ